MDGNTDQKSENLIPHASDGTGSRPAKKFSTWIEEKGLVIILVVLCVVVVVLAAFAIINAVQKNTSTQDEGMQYTTMSEGYSIEAEAKLSEARSKAEALMSQDAVNASEIIDLYAPYIDEYAKAAEPDRIAAYVWDRNDALLSRGFKEEALDVLLNMDLDILNEAEKYRQYANIVALARELGKDDIANQYYGLLTSDVDWGDAAIERFTRNIIELEAGGNNETDS